jgi:hypothetical protein
VDLATNAALFNVWETGSFPGEEKIVLASAKLEPGMLYAPEGKDIAWDVRQRRAVSEVYGTLEFATPSIELPIDRITETEQREYLQFRGEYLGLWRQFFDPIGMRLTMTDRQVRLETYILPLIQNSSYNELRRVTGNGTTKLQPNRIPSRTIAQLVQHLDPNLPALAFPGGRDDLWLRMLLPAVNFLGDWFLVRLDDSPVYAKFAAMYLRQELDPEARADIDPVQMSRLAVQVPVTFGASIKNPVTLAALLASVRTAVDAALPGGVEWGPLEAPYEDIVRVRPRPNPEVDRLFGNAPDDATPVLPALHYALIDGALYVSLHADSLKQWSDQSRRRREGKEPAAPGETVAVNSSLYLAPGAAQQAGPVLRQYLEYETHRRAVANLPIRYVLYRCAGVRPTADEDEMRRVALRYFGFVPVSPDGSGYRFDPATREVVNDRHGSLRRPRLQAEVAPDSAAAGLLKMFRSVRADLRFREDGVHTVLTVERGEAK